MPGDNLIRGLLLPDLELTYSFFRKDRGTNLLEAKKTSAMEVCPKCATPSKTLYDRRLVRVRDAPIRDKAVTLTVQKRRFFCKPCQKPFTEPIAGVRKGCRTTERYRRSVLWACENFSDLKAVRVAYRCSAGFIYRTLYHQLELRRRQRLYPWPTTVGIDEHFFRRHPYFGTREFVSVLVDFKGRRLMEVVNGRTSLQLKAGLDYIPGRHNVRFVVLDMSDGYKSFAKAFFPKAQLVADKFHVLRLLSPHINRRRRLITGDKRTLGVRRLLLRSAFTLHHGQRFLLNRWLQAHPELNEVYRVKEAMHSLYRVRGFLRAGTVLTRLTDELARTQLPELKTLRRTLMKWRTEILAYFATGLTNGRTEGFNNKAKLVKRRAYGYRSFANYRLRLLNACA